MQFLAGRGQFGATDARRLTAIVAGSLIVFLLVSAWLLVRQPLDYYYDDALFYLQIGRSFAEGRGLEFARDIQTNGFHPAWMLVCAMIARIGDGDPWRMIAIVGVVTAGLAIAWSAVCWFGLKRHFAAATVGLGLIVAIPYALFAGVGMESPLAILLFAAFMVSGLGVVTTGTARSLMLAALFGGLTVFARIDLLFIIMPPAALLAWSEARRARSLGAFAARALPAFVLGVVPVAAWLAFNRVTFGAATPISGMLKLASASAHRQFPVLNGVVLLILAVVVATTALAALRWREPRQQFAVAIGIGQLLFVAYLFVAGHREAYAWYFVPLSASLALLVPAGISGAAIFGRRGIANDRRAMSALLLVGTVGLIVAASALLLRTTSRNSADATWFTGERSLGRVARANGIDTVLAFDLPGQLAFLDGLNVIAADGLTTNLRFQHELRQHGIAWLLATYHVRGIVAPRLEDPRWPASTCTDLYLNAIRFICETTPSGRRLRAIRFLSRLDGSAIGEVEVAGLRRLDIALDRKIDVYVLPRPPR